MATLAGGKGPEGKVDAETTTFLASQKGAIEAKSGKTYSEFTPISSRSQVVAGKNLFAKIKTGPSEYIHVKIWRKLGDGGNEITEVSDATETSAL